MAENSKRERPILFSPELLPCPWSNSDDIRFTVASNNSTVFAYTEGPQVYARVIFETYETNEEAALKTAYEMWNTRVYPAEVQAAIEREKPKRPIRLKGYVEIVFECPSCSEESHWFIQDNPDPPKVCCECGQRLDWSEE